MTVHVAGEVVRAQGLVVQRCAWCGGVLVRRVEDPTQITWPPGAMTDGDALYEGPGLPADSCLLDEL